MSESIRIQQHKQHIKDELLRDPSQTNAAIRAALNCRSELVTIVRRELGLNEVSRRRGLREGAKSFRDRVAEICPLADKGMTVDQIARVVGMSKDRVTEIIRRSGSKVVTDKALRLNPRRMIDESVTSLAALANGLSRIKHVDIAIEQQEALAMLQELSGSKRNIDWLYKFLRGKAKEPNHESRTD